MRWSPVAALAAVCTVVAGCGTLNLGDDIVPPDVQLDEDFFHCGSSPTSSRRTAARPEWEARWAPATPNRSALRLVATMDPPPECADGVITGGTVSTDSIANLEAVRFEVQSDALSSPFYRRPTGLDSHPRVIFPENDPAAQLIVEWISRGSM